MKAAVTGATGLIGTELTKLLDQKNIEWLGLSRKERPGSYVQTDYSVEDLTHIFSDVDVVVHLAAIRGRDSKNGYQDYAENEILTEHILQAMVQSKPKKIIFMSSISVYSELSLLPWEETMRPSPVSFYGLSKLTGEYLCERYRDKGIEPVIFRCAHVLGLEEKGYMLGRFLHGAAKKETLTVIGKSLAKREFIYVKDAAGALAWAIEQEKLLGIYNLGTGIGHTNYEVADTINRCFENKGNLHYQDETKETIVSSYMNVERLYRAGFTCAYTLEEGVKDIKREKFDV